MPRLPTLSARKLIKVLKKKGYIHLRTTGSHQTFIRKEDQSRITVPMHKGRDLGRGLTRSILDNAGITIDELLKLLKK